MAQSSQLILGGAFIAMQVLMFFPVGRSPVMNHSCIGSGSCVCNIETSACAMTPDDCSRQSLTQQSEPVHPNGTLRRLHEFRQLADPFCCEDARGDADVNSWGSMTNAKQYFRPWPTEEDDTRVIPRKPFAVDSRVPFEGKPQFSGA
jgi:hypothetical protein